MGKSGIEQTYEEVLRGQMGTRTVEVNALSRPIRTVNTLEPVPGYNITLTLDAKLQAVAQQAFSEHILTLKDEPGTQTGGVLALNPPVPARSWSWPASRGLILRVLSMKKSEIPII